MLQKNYKQNLFFNKSTVIVAELFFDFPSKSFHLRKIVREIKNKYSVTISTTAVKKSTDKLLNFKIVKMEKKAVINEFKADLDSKAFYDYKRIFNLYEIKRHALVGLLVSEFNPETIVLFGSYSRGEDNERSDIDLLIISKRNPDIDLSEYEKVFNRRINLIVLKDLSRSEPEFINTISNGIVLWGYLGVV